MPQKSSPTHRNRLFYSARLIFALSIQFSYLFPERLGDVATHAMILSFGAHIL